MTDFSLNHLTTELAKVEYHINKLLISIENARWHGTHINTDEFKEMQKRLEELTTLRLTYLDQMARYCGYNLVKIEGR